MKFDDYLHRLQARENLEMGQAEHFLGMILDDKEVSDQQIVDTLTALTLKKPTVDEVHGFVNAMKSRMYRIHASKSAIDTCGTGGDKTGTFNISTAAALLIASAGIPVVKHGNRAATSQCGSADVLEALGIPIDMDFKEAVKSLERSNFVFLFAPQYHPALKRLSIIRKSLEFPTVFNILGPLLNPAGVKKQVIGTYSRENAELIASVMTRMEYEHGIVITSSDGLDEAGLDTKVAMLEVKGESITKSEFSAHDFGLAPAPVRLLAGGNAKTNAQIIIKAFKPKKILNPHQRVIVLNAALGFYAANVALTLEEGIKKAQETLLSGRAAASLNELRVR